MGIFFRKLLNWYNCQHWGIFLRKLCNWCNCQHWEIFLRILCNWYNCQHRGVFLRKLRNWYNCQHWGIFLRKCENVANKRNQLLIIKLIEPFPILMSCQAAIPTLQLWNREEMFCSWSAKIRLVSSWIYFPLLSLLLQTWAMFRVSRG